MIRPLALRFCTLCIVLFLVPHAAPYAQDLRAVRGTVGGMPVGNEFNEYLRYLQTVGKVSAVPWGLRGFAPAAVDKLTAVPGTHPWKENWMFDTATTRSKIHVLPVHVTLGYNSSYPFGLNEGVLWSGRGLTTSLSGGVAIKWGSSLSIVLRPTVFSAENQSCQLQATRL
jgi:hypothetical protein